MICSQQLWNNSILDYEKDKSTVKNIYHKGWIDFNKNGVKDIYEDSYAPLEARVQNLLSQMTLEEKSCQMATLYGSGRVLNVNPEKPDVPLNKNDAFQKVQKRRVQEKR